jgi:hypothetical protein
LSVTTLFQALDQAAPPRFKTSCFGDEVLSPSTNRKSSLAIGPP